MFLALALAGPGRRSRTLDWWRGAAAVYLTVTFVVVIALLSNVDVGLQLAWVDVVLHKIFLVVVVADYLLAPPQRRFSLADGLRWLIYPLIWLGYTVVRGARSSTGTPTRSSTRRTALRRRRGDIGRDPGRRCGPLRRRGVAGEQPPPRARAGLTPMAEPAFELVKMAGGRR